MGMSNIFNVSEIIEIIPVTYNKLDIKEAETSLIKNKVYGLFYVRKESPSKQYILIFYIHFREIPDYKKHL